MRRITLPKILRALEAMEPQIEIDPAIAGRARLAVERMTAVRRDAPAEVAGVA
jgi:quinolinate synthase